MFTRAAGIARTILVRLKSRINMEDEMAASRRNIILSTYASGVAGNLAGGNFLTGLLLLMGADDAFIGLVAMVSLAGNLLQILSPLIMERFPGRKRILICCRLAIHLFNIVIIGLIHLFGFTNRQKLTLVIGTVLLVNVVNALSSPGFAIWHIKSIPENIRAKYFSFMSMTNNIIIYGLVLGASRIADKFKASGDEFGGLLLLRLVAFAFALLDIFFLFKIKEYPNEQDENAVKLVHVLLGPFREKKYLVTVCIACLWHFTANIPGPYFSVYLLKDLGVSYSYINLVNMLSVPILIFFTPLWARRIQSTSWFKTLYFSMGIYLIHYIGLSFVHRDAMFLYPVFLVFAFMFAPGINLAFSNIPYINIPKKNQTNYIGFYSTMANLSAFLGVTLGREFISFTENRKINMFGVVMQNKQYILILTALLMLLAVAAIYFLQKRVDEGASEEISGP